MKGNFITAYWNNVISIAFGIIAVIYITASLIAGVSTGSFIGLVVIVGSTWIFNETHSAMWFARTKWKIKRLTHPVEIISRVLSICYIAIVTLTFYEVIVYTTGFLAVAFVILIKVPLYIRRNTVLA